MTLNKEIVCYVYPARRPPLLTSLQLYCLHCYFLGSHALSNTRTIVLSVFSPWNTFHPIPAWFANLPHPGLYSNVTFLVTPL